jgi:predicted aspartyl protease
MMDATEYVVVEQFDILLTDIKAEHIERIKIDGVKHLSPATTSTSVLRGVTVGENARVFVKAVVTRSGNLQQHRAINVIMLVDTGSPFVFLAPKTWKAFGVDLADLPNDEAYVKINGVRVLAHVSSNHFADIDVMGTSFLKNCKMTVDYPEEKVEIHLSE